jgi:hypothetical protein
MCSLGTFLKLTPAPSPRQRLLVLHSGALHAQLLGEHGPEVAHHLVLLLLLLLEGDQRQRALLLRRVYLHGTMITAVKYIETSDWVRGQHVRGDVGAGPTWFSFRRRTAFMRACLEPLMTKPCCSRVSISSPFQPISPLRGMRMFCCTNCAMASPSPGNSAPP